MHTCIGWNSVQHFQTARPGKARQGKARQGKARQGKARLPKSDDTRMHQTADHMRTGAEAEATAVR